MGGVEEDRVRGQPGPDHSPVWASARNLIPNVPVDIRRTGSGPIQLLCRASLAFGASGASYLPWEVPGSREFKLSRGSWNSVKLCGTAWMHSATKAVSSSAELRRPLRDPRPWAATANLKPEPRKT